MAKEQSKERPLSEKRDQYIVAAIDFGTTYSGYAYSFKHDFEKDPALHIITNKWEGGKTMSEKAPTCVLFDEEKKFASFGYEAEERYGEIAIEGEEEVDKWYFFQRFKMELHDKKIHRGLTIKDVKGKEMLAKTVFSESIKFLKDHLLAELKKKKTTIKVEEIHWVLTVPAIWTDAAKQFMRESGIEAGLPSKLLSIALEPEAASLYCQHQHIEQDDEQSTSVFEPPKVGTKYAVIDLGGGTADITVHEKQEDGTLKELTHASGGAWGGMYVNFAFQNFLVSIFGADIFTQYQNQCPAGSLDTNREFEVRKRSIKEKDTRKHITIQLSDLLNLYNDVKGADINQEIKEHPQGNKVQFIASRIRVDLSLFKHFFSPCIEQIVKHIKELMKKSSIRDNKVFLLVGGFSQSDVVYTAVKDALPGSTVINPPESGLAVLKGAVIFGHSPVAVSSRIAKYSYGVNISPIFEDGVHPQNRKVTIGEIARCKDVFKKYIEKGTRLTYGMYVPGKHVTVKEFQSDMLLKIFVSKKKDPKFCDEPEAEFAGNLVVRLPPQKARIVVEVKLIVGETELKVEAQEQATNQVFEAYFDFL